MGKSVEETTKRTNLMADSFKIAGGIMTAFGVAGVAIMGDWVKKGIEAQTTIVKTNTLLADEAREMSTTSQAIYANTGSVKNRQKKFKTRLLKNNCKFNTCDTLVPPARFKVLFGGRDSAKSWSIARMLLARGVAKPERILCTREVQKSIAESVHQVLKDQIKILGLRTSTKSRTPTSLARTALRSATTV